MSSATFHQLNQGWNAYPNGDNPRVDVVGLTVRFTFLLNLYAYDAREGDKGRLTFNTCSRWRLGATNDEGWYRGRCRYSKTAPAWGEFYEITGVDDLRDLPSDWNTLAPPTGCDRHFLFYLRDQTFECIAQGWSFDRE